MTESEEEFDVEQFVYVKIPAPMQPIDRGCLLEDPVDAVLAPDNLGHVSGGGSLLGDTQLDGTRSIEFCGIDIDTTDRSRVLQVLRQFLPTVGIPLATELHYTANGCKLKDRFLGTEWAIGESRNFLHPAFDI